MLGLRDSGGPLRTAVYLLESFFWSLRENAGMGLLALALSLSIWVFITNEQNPPRTGVFPFRIPVHPVNVPADLDLLGSIDPVVVRITAPSDLWPGLTEESFEATVDLSGLQEGTAEVPVAVRPKDGRVRLLETVPSQVTVQLDHLQRQVVPVQVNVVQAPPVGFGFQPPRTDVQQATVIGPERLVSTVDAAMVDVNLSAARAPVRQSLPLVPRTARGYDISGVRLDPASVVVEITVEAQFAHQSLPVVADVQGAPAAGYTVTGVRITPQVLAVTGPQELLQSLSVLKTAPVDISNLSSSVTRTAAPSLPTGVTLLDRNAVQVEITIQPVRGTAVVQVAPRVTGLGDGLTAALGTPSLQITVAGEGPPLREVTPDRVRATVDLDGRGPGSYSLEPAVELPPGLRVASISPTTVSVEVKQQ